MMGMQEKKEWSGVDMYNKRCKLIVYGFGFTYSIHILDMVWGYYAEFLSSKGEWITIIKDSWSRPAGIVDMYYVHLAKPIKNLLHNPDGAVVMYSAGDDVTLRWGSAWLQASLSSFIYNTGDDCQR